TWCSVDNATPLLVLASSAIRCRFVDRFVRLKVLSRGRDRNRARPTLGEGFPFLLFRLQAGSQSHLGGRFSTPPHNARRPDFSGPVWKLCIFSASLPKALRGLNPGSDAPHPSFFGHSTRS